jgi:hypothetical protein
MVVTVEDNLFSIIIAAIKKIYIIIGLHNTAS